jgi:hypothetical protein
MNEDAEENKQQNLDRGRGRFRIDGIIVEAKLEGTNWCITFGCKPDAIVPAQTKMVKDVSRIIDNYFDAISQTIEFPKCLYAIKGVDVQFESV